jgi:hypothetical protein
VAAAKAILESRGGAPRLYRNTLVFLAVDKARLQDLDEAARRYLAWESIVGDKETLNLDPHQVKQAETQKGAADGAVTARLPEAYQWLLVPTQERTAQAPVEWQAVRLTGQDALAVRASKRLKSDEMLVTTFAASRLRMELDRVLWRGDHVAIKQLVEDFARYLYLPRLKEPDVLLAGIRDGLALLTWDKDTFAYADSYDEEAKRYRGLRGGERLPVAADAGLLVKPDVAKRQLAAEAVPKPSPEGAPVAGPCPEPLGPGPVQPRRLKRFHGTVDLNPTRVGRDAGRIADEVIAHLAGLVRSRVKVTLEIEAEIPDGAPENVVRTVTENARTLKFSSQGFEAE